VKYLINQDGTVSTPNVTPNSLQLNQGNFQTGERVFLATQNEIEQITFQGSDYNTNYREIVRGATRIEPILYNQSGSSPARWGNIIEFENKSAAAVKNIEVSGSGDGDHDIPYNPTAAITRTKDLFTLPSTTDSVNISSYEITASCGIVKRSIDDGLDGGVNLRLYLAQSNTTLASVFYGQGYWDDSSSGSYAPVVNCSIYPTTYYGQTVRLEATFSNVSFPSDPIFDDADWRWNSYAFSTNQYPSPGELPSISITSSIWEPTTFPTPSNGIKLSPGGIPLYSLFIENQTDPTWYFKGIPNSDYGDILTPWNIQRGDEFRFEGDVNKVYMVDYVVTGSTLEVMFDPSFNPSTIDINKYSITRYVDDASKIIIKGFRPNNTTGPYILRPEFIVPELDKGIDEFIVDLTQKGLL
jgi:hypothetical protein